MKTKELKNLSKKDREKKMKELQLELVKSKVSASKTGSSKSREIRKMIAKLITFNKSEADKSTQSLVQEELNKK
jgi:ribosomal protein L29